MTPGLTLNSVPPSAYASMPARPYSPTPMSTQDLSRYLYGSPTTPGRFPDPQQASLPTPMQPSEPLPSWIPQNVQDRINQAPAYAEGQRQGVRPNIAGGEPYSPTPQIDDIYRQFQGRINRNAPSGTPMGGKFLHDMILSGHLGGSGGADI